jgi:hypothetical protein
MSLDIIYQNPFFMDVRISTINQDHTKGIVKKPLICNDWIYLCFINCITTFYTRHVENENKKEKKRTERKKTDAQREVARNIHDGNIFRCALLYRKVTKLAGNT